MNLSPIALAHLSAIVLASAEHIESIRTHGSESIKTVSPSIKLSKAMIAFNTDKDITKEEKRATFSFRMAIREAIANEYAQIILGTK